MLLGGPAAAGSGAHVQFGRLDTGSGCIPPECFDDASYHSQDRMLPGAVNVRVGEPVHFSVEGFHQVVVLADGTRPQDVEPAGFFMFPGTPGDVVAMGAPMTDFTWTPTSSGKFLVVCNVAPHFEFAQMWGWVHAR